MRTLTFIAISIGLLVATALNIRFAYADRLRRQPSLYSAIRATELNPLNAQAFFARARYEEQEGRNAEQSWAKAIELDPRNPRILIQAGISSEIHGDFKKAEELYLMAERFNALWLPRWTLANFYFRQNQPQKTIFWIQKALDRAWPSDLNAAFDLAVQSGASPSQILEQIIPPNPRPYAAYGFWLSRTLLDQPRAELLEKTTHLYLQTVHNGWRWYNANYFLIVASRHLMNSGFGQAARRVWLATCQNGLLDCPSPPDDGLIINGRLSKSFIPKSLDWELPRIQGVTSLHQPGSGTVKYSITGEQPEHCELFRQLLPIPAQSRWVIKFEFQTRDITPSNAVGLEWFLNSNAIQLSRPLSSESAWTEATLFIDNPNNEFVAPLTLALNRKLGTIRIKGDLWIRNIHAERR